MRDHSTLIFIYSGIYEYIESQNLSDLEIIYCFLFILPKLVIKGARLIKAYVAILAKIFNMKTLNFTRQSERCLTFHK